MGCTFTDYFPTVEIESSDFTIRNVLALSDGRIYVEYSHPYTFADSSVNVTSTKDGAEYWQYHRPSWSWMRKKENM